MYVGCIHPYREIFLREAGCFAVGYYVGFISLFSPSLYPLKLIYLKDGVKVSSHKLVNPDHELTISFAKGVGMAK